MISSSVINIEELEVLGDVEWTALRRALLLEFPSYEQRFSAFGHWRARLPPRLGDAALEAVEIARDATAKHLSKKKQKDIQYSTRKHRQSKGNR